MKPVRCVLQSPIVPTFMKIICYCVGCVLHWFVSWVNVRFKWLNCGEFNAEVSGRNETGCPSSAEFCIPLIMVSTFIRISYNVGGVRYNGLIFYAERVTRKTRCVQNLNAFFEIMTGGKHEKPGWMRWNTEMPSVNMKHAWVRNTEVF